MKRIATLILCVAAISMATSCANLGGAAANSAARLSGQACGAAVQSLYSSYRSTGKLDLTSGNNLNNALALATAYTTLQQNRSDASYRKAFATGLIAASAGLITSANATQFIDRLLATTALSGLTANKISQTASTAAAIIQLLSVLK